MVIDRWALIRLNECVLASRYNVRRAKVRTASCADDGERQHLPAGARLSVIDRLTVGDVFYTLLRLITNGYDSSNAAIESGGYGCRAYHRPRRVLRRRRR